MPTPVYAPGTPGNLINGVAVAHGATIAALLDLSAAYEGQVDCEVTTGGTAPTVGTTFSAYKVKGNATPNTLSAAASAGATSLSVAGSAGLHPGQQVLLQQASGSKLGELVTITGAITGAGPYTVPITATINAYASGDGIDLISQTATAVVTPAAAGGGWAASADYSATIFLGTGLWAIAAANGDSAQAVTATATVDKVTAYQ